MNKYFFSVYQLIHIFLVYINEFIFVKYLSINLYVYSI